MITLSTLNELYPELSHINQIIYPEMYLTIFDTKQTYYNLNLYIKTTNGTYLQPINISNEMLQDKEVLISVLQRFKHKQ